MFSYRLIERLQLNVVQFFVVNELISRRMHARTVPIANNPNIVALDDEAAKIASEFEEVRIDPHFEKRLGVKHLRHIQK